MMQDFMMENAKEAKSPQGNKKKPLDDISVSPLQDYLRPSPFSTPSRLENEEDLMLSSPENENISKDCLNEIISSEAIKENAGNQEPFDWDHFIFEHNKEKTMAAGSESLCVAQTDGFLTDSNVEDNESLYPLMSSTKIDEEDQNFAEMMDFSEIQIHAADLYTYLNKRYVKKYCSKSFLLKVISFPRMLEIEYSFIRQLHSVREDIRRFVSEEKILDKSQLTAN